MSPVFFLLKNLLGIYYQNMCKKFYLVRSRDFWGYDPYRLCSRKFRVKYPSSPPGSHENRELDMGMSCPPSLVFLAGPEVGVNGIIRRIDPLTEGAREVHVTYDRIIRLGRPGR